jgi:hypothetical protein
MYLVVFYVGKYVGVYTKSKSSELTPLNRKLLRFAKQFPPPLRLNYCAGAWSVLKIIFTCEDSKNHSWIRHS